MNQIPILNENAIEDQMNHFGFNISLVIPFMNDEERKRILQSSKPKNKRNRPLKISNDAEIYFLFTLYWSWWMARVHASTWLWHARGKR